MKIYRQGKMMNKALLITLLLTIGCGKNSQNNPEVIASSIINGNEVVGESLEAQSIVSIAGITSISSCTGTLISENLILTAAHCVSSWTQKGLFSKSKRMLDTRFFIFKSYQKDVKDLIVKAENIELLPASTKTEEFLNDIALIKIASPAPKNFSPVAILDSTYVIPAYTKLTLAGFGYTSKQRDFSLNHNAFKIIKEFAGYVDSANMFGVTQVIGEEGVYEGDSGGPAYLEINGELLLAGSTMGGNEKESLAYFMDVGKYKNFILNTAKKLNATPPIFRIPTN